MGSKGDQFQTGSQAPLPLVEAATVVNLSVREFRAGPGQTDRRTDRRTDGRTGAVHNEAFCCEDRILCLGRRLKLLHAQLDSSVLAFLQTTCVR